MPNTDKQLAELLAEEKKLLEQQKKEQDGLKQKLRAVKKQLREEERKREERRAELVGRCMMQKFNSDPDAKEDHAAGTRWLPVEAGRPGTVRNTPQNRLLKLYLELFLFPDRLP